LVFGYVGFLAFLFEGSARLAFSIPQVGKRLQANDEYTYRRNWVQKHQKFGIEAYYAFDMGVHGYGHDQMLILLKEEGVKYQPDIVILGFLPLDMSRNILKFRDFAKPRFVLERGELRLTGTPVPRPEEILQWDWTRPRILDVFSTLHRRVKKISGLQKTEMEEVTTAILTDMIRLIEGIRAIPILVYLPRGKEIAMDIAVTQDEAYMSSICQLNEKANCFSTRPYFAEKIAQGETFKSRGHWEPAGHRTVAEAIKRYLVDEGYVTVP
jgi:hypothetical protein